MPCRRVCCHLPLTLLLFARRRSDNRVPVQSKPYPPNGDSFNTLAQSLLTAYVFSTTEDFPTVMYPPLHAKPVTATLYFLLGAFLFLWLLIPLFLANVYERYLDLNKRRVQISRVKRCVTLMEAYLVLTGSDGDAELSFGVFDRAIAKLSRDYSPHMRRCMFTALDTDGSGAITVGEVCVSVSPYVCVSVFAWVCVGVRGCAWWVWACVVCVGVRVRVLMWV